MGAAATSLLTSRRDAKARRELEAEANRQAIERLNARIDALTTRIETDQRRTHP